MNREKSGRNEKLDETIASAIAIEIEIAIAMAPIAKDAVVMESLYSYSFRA